MIFSNDSLVAKPLRRGRPKLQMAAQGIAAVYAHPAADDDEG
jgi:hypothetical protein